MADVGASSALNHDPRRKGRKKRKGATKGQRNFRKRYNPTVFIVSAPYSGEQKKACQSLNRPVLVDRMLNAKLQEVNGRVRLLKGVKILSEQKHAEVVAIVEECVREMADLQCGDQRGDRLAIGGGLIFGRCDDHLRAAKHAHHPAYKKMVKALEPYVAMILEWVDEVIPDLQLAPEALIDRIGDQLQQHLLFGRFTYLDVNATNISKEHYDTNDHPEVIPGRAHPLFLFSCSLVHMHAVACLVFVSGW